MFATIIPFSRSFDDIGLIYIIPKSLQNTIQVGQIVEIPFKNGKDLGLVYELSEENIYNLDTKKLKEINNISNENIFISGYRLPLVRYISKNYFTPIHNSLSLFLPKNLKEKLTKQKIKFDTTKEYNYKFDFPIKLTNTQEKVYNEILNSKNNKVLLFGVTGSGKTEIYIKLIKKYLDEGKQSLFLIPEIILGNQILERIKKVFGDDVIIINSSIPEAKKTNYFLDILHNNAKIILGTRSALFYPYNNLGLIIIDEEHDSSYISDNPPRYNTGLVADEIANMTGIKLVKASGTPSINSMYNGIKGKYQVINLLEKYIE